MDLFDPHRSRVNDTPELAGRHFAVPKLTIFPRPEGITQISAMIPHDSGGKFSSRQVRRNVTDSDLPEIMAQYRKDPENTLETLFSISLAPIGEPSDADFARDLVRADHAKYKQIKSPSLTPEAKANSIQL